MVRLTGWHLCKCRPKKAAWSPRPATADAPHAATLRGMQCPGWRVHQSDAPVDHTDASIARINLERAKQRS
jgi:hypothetical protein